MSRQTAFSSVALAVGLACVCAHAAQRAFVSSTGLDTNACTPFAPCRSFQTAHGVTDSGGEIVALDAAGYGAVTITKSISILGNPGFITSIAVAAGNAVTIATPGVHVILRNLTINSVGGLTGVEMTAGSSLTIENSVISNFSSDAAVAVYAAARVRILNTVMRGNITGAAIEGASVDVVSSQFMGNSGCGIYVGAIASGTTTVSVSDSVSSGNGTGFCLEGGVASGVARMSFIRTTAANNTGVGFRNRATAAGASVVMTVGSSMASGNATGFGNSASSGSATFESLGNNIVRQNTSDSIGTITAFSGL